MEKNIKTKQELKAGFDLAEEKAANNQQNSGIESSSKIVLFPTEEDGLMKLFKKQQADAQKMKNEKQQHNLDEPFNLEDTF